MRYLIIIALLLITLPGISAEDWSSDLNCPDRVYIYDQSLGKTVCKSPVEEVVEEIQVVEEGCIVTEETETEKWWTDKDRAGVCAKPCDPCEEEMAEPEMAEPEIAELEVIEPEVVEPEVIEPEVVEPEVIEPEEVVEPEVVEKETINIHDDMPAVPVEEVIEVTDEMILAQESEEARKKLQDMAKGDTCTIVGETKTSIHWSKENSSGICTKPCDPCETGTVAVAEKEKELIEEEEMAEAVKESAELEITSALVEMGWYEEEDLKVEGFDLEQQLLRVIRNHPRVIAALKDVEVSKEAIKITNSSRLPQASITTNNGIEEVENPGSDDVNRYYDDQTLTITQLLSDFGRSKAATDKAISDKMITDLSYKQTVQSVVSEGLTAYYGLIKAYNTFKTNSAIMAGLKEQQKQMQAKLEAKKATIDQFNAIKSQVIAQQSLLISLQYAYDMAQNRFSAVFGNLPADVGSMKMAKIDSSIPIPDTEKMAVYWSSKGSISIDIGKQTVESAELQSKVDKKQWAPTITLKMEGITTATGGTDGEKVDKSLYVTMSVPLYTGGMNSAMKRQSNKAVEASLLRLDDTRTTVRESVQNAFAGYKVAEANIKVLLIQYQMAKEALDNAQKQVEAGKMPVDPLTPLKNNLLNMQTSLKNASADLELAKMSLFLALGWLEIVQDGKPTQNSIKITTDSK